MPGSRVAGGMAGCTVFCCPPRGLSGWLPHTRPDGMSSLPAGAICWERNDGRGGPSVHPRGLTTPRLPTFAFAFRVPSLARCRFVPLASLLIGLLVYCVFGEAVTQSRAELSVSCVICKRRLPVGSLSLRPRSRVSPEQSFRCGWSLTSFPLYAACFP